MRTAQNVRCRKERLEKSVGGHTLRVKKKRRNTCPQFTRPGGGSGGSPQRVVTQTGPAHAMGAGTSQHVGVGTSQHGPPVAPPALVIHAISPFVAGEKHADKAVQGAGGAVYGGPQRLRVRERLLKSDYIVEREDGRLLWKLESQIGADRPMRVVSVSRDIPVAYMRRQLFALAPLYWMYRPDPEARERVRGKTGRAVCGSLEAFIETPFIRSCRLSCCDTVDTHSTRIFFVAFLRSAARRSRLCVSDSWPSGPPTTCTSFPTRRCPQAGALDWLAQLLQRNFLH